MTSHYRVGKAVKKPYKYSETFHKIRQARSVGHNNEVEALRRKHNLEYRMPNIERDGSIRVRSREVPHHGRCVESRV